MGQHEWRHWRGQSRELPVALIRLPALALSITLALGVAGCTSDASTPAAPLAAAGDAAARNARATVESALAAPAANRAAPTLESAAATPLHSLLGVARAATATAAQPPPATDTPVPPETPTPPATPTATADLAATQAAGMDSLLSTAVAATLAAQASATAIQLQLATAVAATLTAARPTTTPEPTATPQPTVTPTRAVAIEPLRLAFVRGDIGATDILVLDIDRGAVQTVADRSCDEAEPSWASDGQTIIYQADCGGSYDLYLANVVSGARSQLTFSPDLQERDADIAPDGRRVAFRVNRDHEGRNVDGALWIMDIDGANAQPIGIDGRSPAWSPDGNRLLFMSQRDGGWDVFVFDLRTRSTQRLTSCAGDCRFPVWSPDGDAVAYYFLGNPEEKERSSIRVQSIGSDRARTLVTGDTVGRPAWSATGLVAFNSGLGLEVVNDDGSNRQVLVPDDVHWAPAWSR